MKKTQKTLLGITNPMVDVPKGEYSLDWFLSILRALQKERKQLSLGRENTPKNPPWHHKSRGEYSQRGIFPGLIPEHPSKGKGRAGFGQGKNPKKSSWASQIPREMGQGNIPKARQDFTIRPGALGWVWAGKIPQKILLDITNPVVSIPKGEYSLDWFLSIIRDLQKEREQLDLGREKTSKTLLGITNPVGNWAGGYSQSQAGFYHQTQSSGLDLGMEKTKKTLLGITNPVVDIPKGEYSLDWFLSIIRDLQREREGLGLGRENTPKNPPGHHKSRGERGRGIFPHILGRQSWDGDLG